MNSSQKIALSRIITDLIKADNILDISEMCFFSDMLEKYNISNEHLIAAQKIDFASAVNDLQKLRPQEIKEVMKDMEALTVSDGDCAPEEAFLILALNFCLLPEYNSYCKLISTPITNIVIDKKNIIYTETQFDEDVNAILGNSHNLRYIMDDFNVAGLNFVYIPKISKDFRLMNEEYLTNVIRFLAPSLSKDKHLDIFDTLRDINTKGFCDEFLINKMRLDPIFDSDPSILFQVCISNSKVIYLHIALGEDIMDDLRKFVDLYKRLTRFNISNLRIHREDSQRFIYHGFHRALFDLLAFPGENIESRIIFNIRKSRVEFSDLGETLNLPTKQLALYMFIIHQSIFARNHELEIEPISEIRKKANQRIFASIFGMMSEAVGNDYKVGLTPALAHIKKAIKSINFLDNVDSYLPERTKEGTIRVKIKPSKVFVIDNNDNLIPINESETWKSL